VCLDHTFPSFDLCCFRRQLAFVIALWYFVMLFVEVTVFSVPSSAVSVADNNTQFIHGTLPIV